MIFCNASAIGGFGPLLPEIARAQGLADWQLGVLAGAFGVARTPLGLPAGRPARRPAGAGPRAPPPPCRPPALPPRGSAAARHRRTPRDPRHGPLSDRGGARAGDGGWAHGPSRARRRRRVSPQYIRVLRDARHPRRHHAGGPAAAGLELEPLLPRGLG